MKKARLLKLADLLEADADNKKGVKFDLSAWAIPSNEDGLLPTPEVPPVDCQTSACAMGLACISGAFKREGLDCEFTRASCEEGYILEPRHDGFTGFGAAQSLFNISRIEAAFLFDPDEYPESKIKGAAGERFVAKRIRDFVAGKVFA